MRIVVEGFSEVAGGAETAVFADGGDAAACREQHPGGGADAVVYQVIYRGDTDASLKTSGTFPGTDAGGSGNFVEGDFFRIVCVDIVHHLFQPFLIHVAALRTVFAEGGRVLEKKTPESAEF